VLFFAAELSGEAILEGRMDELLPGLRGALASTLTGILGSLAVGLLSSAIGRMLDQLGWETEAFLGGPVGKVLKSEPEKQPVKSEVELWESLREEVAILTRGTQEAYNRMADDAHKYGVSLQELQARLNNLPQVQVPEQLGNLEKVVADFAHGAKIIGETVPPLVDAVKTLGVFAPAKLLTDVDRMTAAVESGQRLTAEVLSRIENTVQDSGRQLGTLDQSLRSSQAATTATLLTLKTDTGGVLQNIGDLRTEVARVPQQLNAGVRQLQDVSGSLSETADRLQASSTGLGDDIRRLKDEVQNQGERADRQLTFLGGQVQSTQGAVSGGFADTQMWIHGVGQAVEDLHRSLGELPSKIDDKVDQLQANVAQIEGVAAQLERTGSSLHRDGERVTKAADDLTTPEGPVARIANQLGKLERVFNWHDRASHAPFMSLLLSPLWRRRSVEDGANG
jgi:ABC-type transporter Mla subunit MlaD